MNYLVYFHTVASASTTKVCEFIDGIYSVENICLEINKNMNSMKTFYSNQPTQQQPELVSVIIRGSVLFYSSAVWRPDFHSVAEFRYLYLVDLIKLRHLFYRWKMCCDHFDNTNTIKIVE